MRDLICAHSSHGQLTVRYSQYHVKMGMQRERDSRKHQQKHKIYTKDVRKKQRHEAGSDKKQRLKLNNIEMCVVITGYVIGKKKKSTRIDIIPKTHSEERHKTSSRLRVVAYLFAVHATNLPAAQTTQ